MKRRTKEPEPEPAGDIMTLQGAANYLHCRYSTLYRLARQARFPHFAWAAITESGAPSKTGSRNNNVRDTRKANPAAVATGASAPDG
jgi:hypothetical protein